MNSFKEVSAALQIALTDLQAGGELQVVHQILEMKRGLNSKISFEQQKKTQQIKDQVATINELKGINIQEPTQKHAEVSNLVNQVSDLKKEAKSLLTERNALVEQLKSLTKEVNKNTTSKQSEQQKIEAACQLFHQITGVFWEDQEVGYVLSEEIAKPIKYSDSQSATDQLWEMIDM
ncbi:hypothetical protein SS50377_28335 [Spironucleus salmonicida]|uniref:Kinetochore protein Spc24 n=1 Tax=Spironucleus salmonicida TaxID=348837 RepID=V6LLR3_9EUKA|nr:hypothetical protein SS50377_28335 [Spironucleus salmonicida]|eukprot:EST45547.1 hypothetical protein SS50377_14513 [Spironucleus salmonicida]